MAIVQQDSLLGFLPVQQSNTLFIKMTPLNAQIVYRSGIPQGKVLHLNHATKANVRDRHYMAELYY